MARAGKFSRLLTESLASLVDRTVYDPRLRQVLGFPAVFLGASPFIAPSMFHLMSALDLEGGVQYPMGGFGRIIESIERLARAEGVEIITNAPVRRIVVEDGVATSVEYTDGKRLAFVDADIVVSAADLHHTETELLPAGSRTYPESYWETRTPGPGALLLDARREGRAARARAPHPAVRQEVEEGIPGDLRRPPDGADAGVAVHLEGQRNRPGCGPRGIRECLRARAHPSRPVDRPGRGEGGDGDPGLEKLADQDHRADRRVGGDHGSRRADRAAAHRQAPATSRPTSTPGGARRSGPRTRFGRARSSAPAIAARRSKGCTTSAARRSPASACRCASSARSS